MATKTRSQGGNAQPTFSEVLGENAPYIAGLYLLNLAMIAVFIDYGALLEGTLTYTALFPGGGSGAIARTMAAGFAGLFVVITLAGILIAISLGREKYRSQLDDYELEERISLISIVPAIQLFAVILSPVLTHNTIVDGMAYLITALLALL